MKSLLAMSFALATALGTEALSNPDAALPEALPFKARAAGQPPTPASPPLLLRESWVAVSATGPGASPTPDITGTRLYLFDTGQIVVSGCNHREGEFTLNGDQFAPAGAWKSTLMACPHPALAADQWIDAALGEPARLTWRRTGRRQVLELHTATGRRLVFDRPALAPWNP